MDLKIEGEGNRRQPIAKEMVFLGSLQTTFAFVGMRVT